MSDCPARLLEHGIFSLPRPTDSESPDPRWVLLTVQSEKRWFRGPDQSACLRLHPLQGQAAREDQGVWPPGAPPPPGCPLSTCTQEPLLPAPVPASLPGPMSQPERRSLYSCLWAWRVWPELGLEGWGCSCLSSRFLRAQRGSEPEVGRAGGGLGGWVGPSLCCPAFWLGAQCPKPRSARY